MSTSQFRIREFQAANDRLFVARDILSRGRAELECQENELTEALSRVDYLKKRLAAKKLLVQSDEQKLKDAELNLKEVEKRCQVHNVDDATDVTLSSPNKTTVDANAAEGVIDVTSPSPTATTSINSSDDSHSNVNDEDKDETPSFLVSTTSNDNDKGARATSNVTEGNVIALVEDEVGMGGGGTINGTFFSPSNVSVTPVRAQAGSLFLFKTIEVKDCRISEANGKYKPETELHIGNQVYSKPGYYQGKRALFIMCVIESRSYWVLGALCVERTNGTAYKVFYISKPCVGYKDNIPSSDGWFMIADGVLSSAM